MGMSPESNSNLPFVFITPPAQSLSLLPQFHFHQIGLMTLGYVWCHPFWFAHVSIDLFLYVFFHCLLSARNWVSIEDREMSITHTISVLIKFAP